MAMQAHVESLSDRSAEAIGLFVRLTRAIEHGRFMEATKIRSRLNELGFVLSFKPEQSRHVSRRSGGGTIRPSQSTPVAGELIKPFAPAVASGQAGKSRKRDPIDPHGSVAVPSGID